MKEHVIQFNLDGTVEAMHSDEFNLGFLGKQSIRRASELMFNEETQLWDIELFIYNSDGELVDKLTLKEARGFDSYESCRKAEVRWLNAARRVGVEPQSPEGLRILENQRGIWVAAAVTAGRFRGPVPIGDSIILGGV